MNKSPSNDQAQFSSSVFSLLGLVFEVFDNNKLLEKKRNQKLRIFNNSESKGALIHEKVICHMYIIIQYSFESLESL